MTYPWRLVDREGRVVSDPGGGSPWVMAFHTREGAVALTKLDARYANLRPVNITSLSWRLKSIARKKSHHLCLLLPHKYRTVIFNDEFTGYEYKKGLFCDRCGASKHV